MNQTKFHLETLQEQDLERILFWRNQKHIRCCFLTDHEIKLVEHKAWYKGLSPEEKQLLKVLYYETIPIGFMNLAKMDKVNHICHWGFYIGDNQAPKGSGTAMGILALQFLFEELNIRKVCAEVLEFNTKSIRFHERLGFEREGKLKKQWKKEEKYVDILLFGFLQEDWFKQKTKLIGEEEK
ncbi:MAG: UDP-4-amino-4,6-dideoxy-N-acetyl-beta-L-altrosamine N-acetyltransferase [Bacillus sp. (in: firmicutes)]